MPAGVWKATLLLTVLALHGADRCSAQSLMSVTSRQSLAEMAPWIMATEEQPQADSLPYDSELYQQEAGSLLQLAGEAVDRAPRILEPSWRQASWSSLSGWSNRTSGLASQHHRPPQVSTVGPRPYGWQMLPQGLMYHSYVAGEKEPRIGLSIIKDPDLEGIWEATLGGRIGIIRFGTRGAVNPEGWQVDLEAASLSRVDYKAPSAPLLSTDYRAGILLTRRRNGTAVKAGYYHISSHLGDEFVIANPMFPRLNYVRDSLVLGVTQDLSRDWQGYGEIGYAIGLGGGSEPLEFQFGLQYDQRDRTNTQGAPFAALNVHLREEHNFGGGINVLAGWRWRGDESGHVLRIGLQFYNGKSLQYSFLNQSEQFVGTGVWFDF